MSWGRPGSHGQDRGRRRRPGPSRARSLHRSRRTGYTGVSGVSGFGHHGHHQGRPLFDDRASLSMLITVVPQDKVPSLVTGLRRLLEDRHGVFFVTRPT